MSGIRLTIAALLLALLPAGEESAAIELSGSFKTLAFTTEDSLGTTVYADLNRLRLELEDSGEHFAWHIAYDNELLLGTLVNSPGYLLTANTPSPTWLDAEARLARSSRYDWQHNLHRGWLRMEYGALSLTAGRQRIAWGSARLWNPSDRFNPVDPTALEPDEKLGVDALLGVYAYSGFGAFQLVHAPGNVQRGASVKSALRWRDTFGESDIALMLGRIGQERVISLDFVTNFANGGLYLESLYARTDAGPSYLQAAFGYDYTLSNDLFPNGLYLLAEYFHNGAATLLPSVDRLSVASKSLLGMSAGYDLTPLWRINAMAIFDLEGGSRFLLPSLTYSLSENSDLQLLAMLSSGRITSAFGQRPELFALQYTLYF